MRQIKFRAKVKTFPIDKLMGRTFENGEWVFGELHIATTGVPHIHTDICNRITIDTDTIGQFTGLHDKNGREIYEGDLLNGYGGKKRFFKVVYFENEACFLLRNVLNEDNVLPLMIQDCDTWRVAGNIHDNPELLKD